MVTLRIKYSKRGEARFTGHLDTQQALLRAIRRARIPIEYTRGFHPRPRISSGTPLPLGYESLCEYLDIDLRTPLAPRYIESLLMPALPLGFELLYVGYPSPAVDSLMTDVVAIVYQVVVPTSFESGRVRDAVRGYQSAGAVPLKRERKGKQEEVDLKRAVGLRLLESAGERHRLELKFYYREGRAVCRPEEVIQTLLSIEDTSECRIIRTEVVYPTVKEKPKQNGQPQNNKVRDIAAHFKFMNC